MSKKTIWIIVGVVVVIVLIIWGVGSNSKPASQTGTIKIGADLSLSGIAVQDGESIRNGLELARADLKKQGINVEIVYQDDKTDPKDTVSAMNLLGAQGVDAVIGPTWSFLADAGVPVADSLHLVTVMPANTSEYVGARSPYAFFTTAKVEKLSTALTVWLKASGKKSVAIISSQGAWYETVDKAVEVSVAQAGGTVVFKDTVPLGGAASAMGTIAAKLKAANPDIIFAEIDDDQGIVVMFKKIQDLQLKSTIMSVTTSIGRVLASDAINVKPTNNIYVVAPQSSKEFDDKYRAVYGTGAKPYADRAYDSLMLLVDAIRNRGSMPLADYLKTRTNYKGYVGTYKFDQNGDITGGDWVVRSLN